MWLYFEATHHRHALCNPLSLSVVDELGEILAREGRGQRVLDIACGHGEILVRWAERHGFTGVGVDLSPYALKHAGDRHRARVPDADLRFVEGDGAAFATEERFDVAMLVGASWIWKGYEGTLAAMKGFARPGGVVVFGEPWWREEPTAEYLEAEKLKREDFTDLEGLRATARGMDLSLLWMSASTERDWDRYEMLQAAGADAFARENPGHPDLPEIRRRREEYDRTYLTGGRRCLGFALWAFRVPG